MKPKQVKKLLMDEIRKVSQSIERYCINPSKDFTRTRKLPIEKLMLGIIGMESGSITNELLDYYDISPETPTASAFVQQRNKLKPEALEAVFKGFSQSLCLDGNVDFPMFAIDGSDIQVATNPDDPSAYFPGTNGQKDYNLLHLNALYNLDKHIYVDAVIQSRRDWNEHEAFVSMVDKSKIPKALVIADRGYESYNNMAHIQEKGWCFLIRIKDGRTGIKDGLDLPAEGTFDIDICMKLTRKQTKEVRELLKDRNHYKFLPINSKFDFLPQSSRKKDPAVFYELSLRVVRFQISDDTYETILTNLDRIEYPPGKIKELYALRWGIETSFRDLKYTVGMLDFHSKKTACIKQEIYSHMIMYNFAETVTSQVSIRKKKRKHTYKANFSVAVHICRLYYRNKVTLSVLESIIAKNLIPIRLSRHRDRDLPKKRVYHGFLYRVA
ncbi:MAG: IS4 family transposase [Lachnospiraceae bacterium]|nr:IS4 family transposase [Lachnospiraceae bacterium]